MNATDIEFYQNVITSEECQCGAWKSKGLPLCYVCNKKVGHLHGELFRGSLEDRAEAYDDAVKFLNE